MFNFAELVSVLVGFFVSLIKLLLGGLGAGLFVLGLCLCGCTFASQGSSSGSIGVKPYEVVNWEETHDLAASADSPALSKAIEAALHDGD